MNYTKHDKNMEILTVKEELNLEFEELEFEELECEDYKPVGFGTKLIELLGLQNVPADTDASKVSTCQNDQGSSQIIIKEEIDCDDGSVSVLDSLHFADKVAGTTLRRSSRRRCQRFSVGDLLESSSDETLESKQNKKVRIQSSSHCNSEKRLSTALEGGKFYEHFCDICGRRFSQLRTLRRHAATHSASKPYTCGQCRKSFKRSDSLREHERLHGGKKYRCAECGREFSQPQQLSRHARMHTGEFRCADCGKVLSGHGHLRVHERIHTGERPFHCEECGKAFRTRQHLCDHVRIHTGERPFSCRVCGKAFRQAAHLHHHAHLHTSDQRYGCDDCGRRFFRRRHLKLHAPCCQRQRKLQS